MLFQSKRLIRELNLWLQKNPIYNCDIKPYHSFAKDNSATEKNNRITAFQTPNSATTK